MADGSRPALDAELAQMGGQARAAAQVLRLAPAEQRTRALLAMAEALQGAAGTVLAANAQDVAAARNIGLAENLVDRLALDPTRLAGVAAALRTVAAVPDPVGVETEAWTRPNGLAFSRVRTPIGVIAMIYEARPNVTADAAALCLRAANACILRGGSESLRSNLAIHAALVQGLAAAGLPPGCIQIVPHADRAAVGLLLQGLDGAVDLLIPRGGRSLVERVRAEARVATLGHLEGLCHTYVHASADPAKARAIVLDAKLRRTSVCGATETLLIDAEAAMRWLPVLAADLAGRGCALRGDARARALVPAMADATEADWRTEHLAAILNVRVVDGVDVAADHVATYGSGHTDAIVAEDVAAADRFCARVDSAIVLVNASTQFADGGEFGFGAEIGISTDRLHARGPVGAEQLTTYKYVVRGTGQVRG